MDYKRIFTFGCSFTHHCWPTWADVIAVQTKIPVFNGAMPGMGNVGITYRIIEYDQRFKFNEEDLILVMWTSWTREDRYLNNVWQNHGNIFNNPLYDKTFIKKYWSWDNDVIKNSSSIILANKAFNIRQNFYAMNNTEGDVVLDSPFMDFYKNSLPAGPVFEQDNNCFKNRCDDRHPDILNHAAFYNKHIAPKFNFPLVKDNSILHKWQEHLEDTFPKSTNHGQHSVKFFRHYTGLLSKKWC